MGARSLVLPVGVNVPTTKLCVWGRLAAILCLVCLGFGPVKIKVPLFHYHRVLHYRIYSLLSPV